LVEFHSNTTYFLLFGFKEFFALSDVKPPVNWTNMILFTLTPLLALTLVPLYGYMYGYDLFEWMAFIVLAGFCGLSITAGYHRLWSHKSYKAHPVLRVIFALGGACALQNDVFHWASDHRRHHQHVDDNDRDPYSAGRGFWFSHMGWILRDYPSGREDFSNIKDLQQDPILRWQHKHYLTLVILMNIGLPALLGFINGDIIGSLLLAGLLRLVLSQHVTWLINSLAHMWGKQNYSEKSSARDNPVIALLTYGEGYHNYHHTFQWDYRNGIKWWHYDPTKWLINACSKIGLTSDLKRCSPVEIEKARLALQYQRATARCAHLGNADKLRERLERDYEQLSQTLHLWYQHQQSCYAAKTSELHEKWTHWEKVELHDSYREIKYKLKIQRQRWQQLMQNFAEMSSIHPSSTNAA
jgi:stearoyl-CoA desaturase (Delta-9 desaturase)